MYPFEDPISFIKLSYICLSFIKLSYILFVRESPTTISNEKAFLREFLDIVKYYSLFGSHVLSVLHAYWRATCILKCYMHIEVLHAYWSTTCILKYYLHIEVIHAYWSNTCILKYYRHVEILHAYWSTTWSGKFNSLTYLWKVHGYECICHASFYSSSTVLDWCYSLHLTNVFFFVKRRLSDVKSSTFNEGQFKCYVKSVVSQIINWFIWCTDKKNYHLCCCITTGVYYIHI